VGWKGVHLVVEVINNQEIRARQRTKRGSNGCAARTENSTINIFRGVRAPPLLSPPSAPPSLSLSLSLSLLFSGDSLLMYSREYGPCSLLSVDFSLSLSIWPCSPFCDGLR